MSRSSSTRSASLRVRPERRPHDSASRATYAQRSGENPPPVRTPLDANLTGRLDRSTNRMVITAGAVDRRPPAAGRSRIMTFIRSVPALALFVMLSALALVAAACQPQEGDVPEDVAAEIEDDDDEADAEADEDCQIEGVDRIQIGGQGALSGAHADYGAQMEMGATLAAEEISEEGGILGCEVEIRFMDSELDPETAITNARFLVGEWGADFLVGVDSSAVALALAPVMDDLDRLLIVTHAATEKLNEEEVFENDHRNVFRMSVPVYQDAIVAAL
ncbi:MAG: ABC transporter substrate-binding protein, partial [Nitriliruptorales bacterium]|nr:ABC transporter substrate-binding protein [Nitriliruptorales bacterium]